MMELCVSRVLELRGLQQLRLMLHGGSPVSGVDFSGMTALTQLHLELSDAALTGGWLHLGCCWAPLDLKPMSLPAWALQ